MDACLSNKLTCEPWLRRAKHLECESIIEAKGKEDWRNGIFLTRAIEIN